MMVAAAAGVVLAFTFGRPIFGLIGLAIAALPIIAVTAGEALWKPWFLEGIEVEAKPPDVSIFALQAMAVELLIVAGIQHQVGDILIAARLIVLLIQFVTIGKFRREHGTLDQPHEISRKSASGADTRHPRKP
jgi:hypothetical protein